jgi:F-type H+-transporting ATPase subunit gamma
MESIQGIKLRLHSISSTQQITKSMQMIATTKVQKTLSRMQQNAPFFEHSRKLTQALVRFAEASRHPYILPKEVGTTVVIAISADRGLCGAYNVNICREAVARIKRLKGDVCCIAIGGKVRDHLRRRKIKIERSFDGASESPSYENARDIGNVALDMYRSGMADKVLLIYTKYESALSQIPTTIQLLPLALDDGSGAGDPRGRLMNFEPSLEEVLEGVVPMYMASSVFGAMLNSASCEQNARIMSMDAASKNCGDMIERLSLQFNRLRQSTITQELNEIVSGAQALQATEEG